MPVTALVNGTSYSWSNVKFSLFGIPLVGITEIDYDSKQKKENNYGAGVEPVSRGYGHKEYKGSITIYLEEWRKVINAAPNKDPMDIKPFDIQVLFGQSGLSFAQDNLLACEFMDDPFSVKTGDGKIMIKLELIIGKIQHL